MQSGKPRWALFALLMLGGFAGCSTFGSQLAGGGNDPAGTTAAVDPAQTPGSAQWWNQNRKKAVFVPGKGYEVAGVPGYFDDYGRPMEGGLVPTGPAKNNTELVSYETETGEEIGAEEGWAEALDPVKGIKRLKRKFGPPRDAKIAQQLYDEGENLFRAKQYDEAGKKFTQAAERWPDSPLEEKSMFMAGESYFFADRYPKANDSYNALIKKYVNTQYLQKVIPRQFAIGRFWEQHHNAHPHWPITPNLFDKSRHLFDTKGHALKAYENIRLNDPTGPLADDALLATANSHFLAKRWGDADYYYGELRKEYPESDYQYQAHLLGLQCKLLCYQGPDYEPTPLVEARQLTEQLLTQFPKELGEDRQRIVQVREQVSASLALRDWNLAKFYEGKSEYGQARYYYENLIKQYPTTKLAEESRTRLTELAGKPAVPPNYFEWLENALPSNESETIMAAQPIDPGGEIRR